MPTLWKLAITSVLFFVFGVIAPAATINAVSCASSDVQKAVNAAANGDTVRVPPGSCTWTSVVQLLDKAITLAGAGVGLTNITHNVSGSMVGLIQFQQHATMTTRITGFSFLGSTYDRRFTHCDGSYASAAFRLDHNSFLSTTAGSILIDIFTCKGLIDHNTITAPSNSEMIHNYGDSDLGWTDDVTPGGADALYVEDNAFVNNGTSFDGNSALQSYAGARTVVRHNTLQDSQLDQHGNQASYGVAGSRWWEFYENTFIITQTTFYQDKYLDLRGGGGVVFNNHKTGAPSNAVIVLRDEDVGYPTLYQIGRGIDQHLSPAYLWGNDATMPIETRSSNVLQGRDFYVSVTQPATMLRWELSADNASFRYSYKPYIYPHPLQSLSLTCVK